MKFFNFIAGFFQDQESGASNGGSRKAIALYLCFLFMWPFAQNGAQGVPVNLPVFYCLMALAAWCIGAITSEMIMKYFSRKNEPPQTPPPTPPQV